MVATMHFKEPIIEHNEQQRYLKPDTSSSFAVLVHPTKGDAMQQADEKAKKCRETWYTVKVDDGYVALNCSGYSVLFGNLPGDDVVYRSEL